MSSDDVEVIDVDDDEDVWAPPTPPPPPPPRRANVDAEDGGRLATEGRGAAALSASRNPLSSSAAVTACGGVEAKLRALPPLRAQADAQTDSNGCDEASAAQATALHARLQAMETALGIRGPADAPVVPPSAVQAAVRGVAAAWREAAAASCKRDRAEQETAQDPFKHVKREGEAQAPAWLPEGDATPSWAAGLEAALDRCRDLLAASTAPCTGTAAAVPLTHHVPSRSTASSVQAAGPREVQRDAHSYRPPHEPTPVPRQPPRQAESDAAATGESAGGLSEAETALLREAQLVCAREHQTSLLPLYTELHALRRQRGTQEQHAAETVAKQLEWEQRRLSDMLAECDAQLDMLERNFEDACKGRLAPIDALQRRMEVLQEFRRKLDAHAAALMPLAARPSSEGAPETAESGAGVPLRRPVGVVGEVLSRYLEEERRGWERVSAALQARLDEQMRRNEELQACYVQANAQLQATIDRDNYVSKDVIAALKVQQQADVAALVRQLGWVLVNSTTDVLSLRHPVTGATLHTNHAYSTINGQTCEDVPTALAAYLVKHSKATGAASASPTPVPPPAAPAQPAQPTPPEVRIDAQHAAAAQRQEEARDEPPAEVEASDSTSTAHTARSEASQPASSDAPPEEVTEEEAEGGEEGRSEAARDATGSSTSAPTSEDADARASSCEGDASAGEEESSEASDAGEEESAAASEDEEADEQDAEHGTAHDDDVEEERSAAGEESAEEEATEEGSSPQTDHDDEEAAEETLVGYSNAPTEEESRLTSSRVDSSGVATSAGPREEEQAPPAAPAPYQSFFASQLWENDAQ